MNTRELLLKKRIESLEGQIKVSIELLGRVLDENEYLSSVACGFAWDLGALAYSDTEGMAFRAGYNEAISIVGAQWASAVEEARK